MKFFVDTADVKEIAKLAEYGLIDGVTTNPSLLAKQKGDFKDVLADICKLVAGPVSAEITARNADTMIAEAQTLATIADNICIKVPLTDDGLLACRKLVAAGHQVNVTLCFSAVQAVLAAHAGATFISPFIGRLDDIGADGLSLLADIRQIYDNYPTVETKILAASIRSVDHVHKAALLGIDVVTVPPAILHMLIRHPLTDKGLDAFLADWQKTGQKIL